MKIFLVLAFVLAASAGSATAQSFEEVQAAYGDYATAFRGVQRLAEQGNAATQYYLGGMYDFGEGVPENDAEAVKWYRRAAEQGDADAQYVIGLMYYKGTGVPRNYLRAHVWTNLAASRLTGAEREQAVKDRDGIAKLLSRSELGRAQRMAEEWRAKTENE